MKHTKNLFKKYYMLCSVLVNIDIDRKTLCKISENIIFSNVKKKNYLGGLWQLNKNYHTQKYLFLIILIFLDVFNGTDFFLFFFKKKITFLCFQNVLKYIFDSVQAVCLRSVWVRFSLERHRKNLGLSGWFGCWCQHLLTHHFVYNFSYFVHIIVSLYCKNSLNFKVYLGFQTASQKGSRKKK